MANTEQALNKAREALKNLLWACSERDNKNRIRQFDEFMDDAKDALAALAAVSAEAATPVENDDLADVVSKAMRRAWQLGQTYWQQADSEYTSHHKKADETNRKFEQLVDETRAAVLAAPQASQPIGQTAEDYLRGKYGAYRGHYEWRDLEEAFNAGKASNSQSVSGAVMTDEELHAKACDIYDSLRDDPSFEMTCFDGTPNIVGAIKATLSASGQAVSEKADQEQRRHNAWAELRAAVPHEVDADFDRAMGIGNADQQPAKPEISIQMTAAGMRVLQNTPEHHLHKYAAGIANSVYTAMAALSSTPAQQTEAPVNVPSGWKLVPHEPTAEMRNEGADMMWDRKGTSVDVWQAMWNAAPAPVQTEAKDAERLDFPDWERNPILDWLEEGKKSQKSSEDDKE